MTPDALIFKTHLEDSNFQIGVIKAFWGVVVEEPQRFNWPEALIWVAAIQKPSSPDRYYFKFNLQNYPTVAPTACPWDNEKNQKLDHSLWPKGNQIVSLVFKPGWNNGNSLYAPCDRMAMPGHENWRIQHPELWWTSSSKITKYLNFIHNLLNSADYAKG